MKNISNFIFEKSKYFTLTDDERNSLVECIGYITGNLGDIDDIKNFETVKKELSEAELKQLDNLYDCLENDETYPKINRNIIKDDLELIKKVIYLIGENDLDYDLSNIYEKIQ